MATKKSENQHTDVRIGISDSHHELRIETALTSEHVLALVQDALKNETPLVITDIKNQSTIIPAKKIAFVELGDAPERRVGFTTL